MIEISLKQCNLSIDLFDLTVTLFKRVTSSSLNDAFSWYYFIVMNVIILKSQIFSKKEGILNGHLLIDGLSKWI